MKKRYYNILAVPAAAVIFFCLFSGFTSEDPSNAAESLIDQRAHILQSALRNDIPYEEAEKKLRKIEGETLLKEDLESLQDGRRDHLSQAYSIKIKEIKLKKQMFQYTTYEANILWDNHFQTAADLYHIVIKEENGRFVLTIFEPAN